MYMTHYSVCHFIIRSTKDGFSWGQKDLGKIFQFIYSENQMIHTMI